MGRKKRESRALVRPDSQAVRKLKCWVNGWSVGYAIGYAEEIVEEKDALLSAMRGGVMSRVHVRD